MTVVGIVVQGVVAVLAALLGAGWLRTRRDKQRQHVETDVTAAGAWQQIAAEHKADKRELETRLDELSGELEAMKKQLAELQESLRDFKDKYRHAVAYIRRLVGQLQRHVEPGAIEPPPDAISSDL